MSDRLARLESELRLQRWLTLAALGVALIVLVSWGRPAPTLIPQAQAGGVTQSKDGQVVYTTNVDGTQLILWSSAGVQGWRATRFSTDVPPGSALAEVDWTPSGTGPR